MLLAVGVLGLGVFADREGENERDVRGGFDGLEQGVKERGELAARSGVRPLHLPKVDGNLVDHDEGGLATEEFSEGSAPGATCFSSTFLHATIAFGTGQAVGQLAPEGFGPSLTLPALSGVIASSAPHRGRRLRFRL